MGDAWLNNYKFIWNLIAVNFCNLQAEIVAYGLTKKWEIFETNNE